MIQLETADIRKVEYSDLNLYSQTLSVFDIVLDHIRYKIFHFGRLKHYEQKS